MTQKTNSPNVLFWLGVLLSNAFAMASFVTAYLINYYLTRDAIAILALTEFVLVPICMGIIAGWFWLKTGKKNLILLLYSLINSLIAVGLSAIFMGEGIICLIIVSPLILAFMWIGILISKYIFHRGRTTLKVSTVSLLALIFVYDTLALHDYHNEVTDQIVINAPRDKVWKYVASHPVNSSNPDYWLFKVGLPQPIQSTVTGDTIGSERKCIFSNGAVFDEVVVEYIPNQRYTFDITKQPDDPEIIGHIEILRGQFLLEEGPNNTTLLIGKSWYRLMVYPVWYYDVWAEDITREVHLRVMEHIKGLAENDI